MKNFIKTMIVLPSLLLLAACATVPKRQPLSLQDRSTIKSDKLVLNTTQREIKVHQNNWFSSDFSDPYAPMDSGAIVTGSTPEGASTPAGQGLLTTLVADLVVAGVTHHRAGKSERAIEPIRAALGNFDYVHYFRGKLNRKVASLPWLKVRRKKLRYNIKANERNLVNASKENTTLFVGTTYTLNSNFKQLEVIAYVKLDEKAEKGKKLKTLYANNFYYIYRLDKPNKNAKRNKAIWMKNHAYLLRNKLKNAASKLSKMIATDIKKPTLNPYTRFNRVVTIRTIDGFKRRGKLISSSNGNNTVALTTGGAMNGFIYIVNRNSIIH